MCAACHSTGLHKNYDLASNSYRTTWEALSVECESCHGPGSAHVTWATGNRSERLPSLGLVGQAMATKGAVFGFTLPDQKIAALQGDPKLSFAANETCLGCHSRRQELVSDKSKEPGAPYLDHYLPSLIEKGLYHADGQIDGEVFEGGSFAQSAMHRAGVVCTNCHEPHSAQLRAPGNSLCVQCHLADYYNQPTHHHHSEESSGALCVNCHMPSKIYMGVHERRDHSLRIPRPDLSVSLGTPNACNQCHKDKSPAWAAEAMISWNGKKIARNDFSAIANAWQDSASSSDNLLAALSSPASGIVKSSLLSLLPPEESSRRLETLAVAAGDADGTVRMAAGRALSGLSSPSALTLGVNLLNDPLRAVRIEAARALNGMPHSTLTDPQKERLIIVTEELIQAELASAERPESHINLAALYSDQNNMNRAEQELKTALRLDSNFVPALVNLADLYRFEQRDSEAEPLLRRAVKQAPTAAEPAHALGLLLIRLGKQKEALVWLQKAVKLAPTDSQYSKVLEVALKEFDKGIEGGSQKK